MKLVLASASASRKALLTAAGVVFQTDPADLDEAALMQGDADTTALALAQAKACHVSARHAGALVLGCDSVIGFDGALVSKCATRADLRALLLRLKAREHLLVSAAALARDGEVLWRHANLCRMAMRDFSETFLDAYLDAECPQVLGSVGGYHFEGRGAQLFERVEGDYFSVLGLPLLPVLAALRQEGALNT